MTIYLDNSATTAVRSEVIDAMLPYLREGWGNPSSVHRVGRYAADGLKRSREQASSLLGCQPEEVYFSSGGTMSNNVALLGRARFAQANGLGKHLITTKIEHPSVMGPAQYLESNGWKVTYLLVDKQGFVSLDDLEKACTPETSMISIMWANNEIGSVQNIDRIAKIAQEREIFFHTDAVQVPGKLAINAAVTPFSALALSGHKFYAPKGVGLLYLRRHQNVMPIVFGGGQEMGLFPGTEGLANIVALGVAAELAQKEQAENESRLRSLAAKMTGAIMSVPGMKISGPLDPAGRLPGHCSFYLPNVEGDALVLRADLKGVCISSGSACHKGIIEASAVLRALRLSDYEAMGAIRVSLGRFTTEEECDKAAKILVDMLKSAASQKSAPHLACP
jgi:cysteine desulfurase